MAESSGRGRMRFRWAAVACALLLVPALYAGPQQTGTKQQQAPDDQAGAPPTLRHLPPGGQPDTQTGQQPSTPSGPSSQNNSPNKSGNPDQPSAQPAAPGQNANSPANSAEPAALPAPPPADAPPLSETSKMQLLRFVDGEFVKVLTPLPGGRDGFHLKAGAPLDQDSLRKALTFGGVALNVGDSGQITRVDFHEREIQIDINNGAKGKTSWRDHVQVIGSGPFNTRTTTTPEDAPAVQQKLGATIFLDFDRPLPDMSGDQLKAYLARVLDFSKRSAAVQYADSLPPQMREAIAAKRAEVGMDHDMVTAAMGRPDRKVRERDEEGNDTEDWIYGTPPQKTIFVTFQGDKVVRVAEYR